MSRAAARTLVAALLALAAALPAPAPAQAGWWDAAGEARAATLDEIRAAPESWRDVPASLVVRFAQTTDLPPAAPGAAALDPAEWRAFSVEGRDADTAAAFTVRRGSAEDARLGKLRAGDQIRIRAAVRSVAGRQPVIEVLWISTADDALSPEEAATLKRAEDLIAKDNGVAAEPLLRSLVEARDLAPVLRAGLWRRIARAQSLQRKHDEAAASLRRVLALDPSDAATARELREVEAAAERAADAADACGRLLRPFPANAMTDLPAPGSRLSAPRESKAAAAAAAARARSSSQPTAPETPKEAPPRAATESAAPAADAPPAAPSNPPVPTAPAPAAPVAPKLPSPAELLPPPPTKLAPPK